MSDIPEVNQPFTIKILCKLNGVVVNLSSGYSKFEIEYKSPSGVETRVDAAILNAPGTDGYIFYNAPVNTFNDPRTWEAKPWLTTTGGDELPGESVDIEIRRKWD